MIIINLINSMISIISSNFKNRIFSALKHLSFFKSKLVSHKSWLTLTISCVKLTERAIYKKNFIAISFLNSEQKKFNIFLVKHLSTWIYFGGGAYTLLVDGGGGWWWVVA